MRRDIYYLLTKNYSNYFEDSLAKKLLKQLIPTELEFKVSSFDNNGKLNFQVEDLDDSIALTASPIEELKGNQAIEYKSHILLNSGEELSSTEVLSSVICESGKEAMLYSCLEITPALNTLLFSAATLKIIKEDKKAYEIPFIKVGNWIYDKKVFTEGHSNLLEDLKVIKSCDWMETLEEEQKEIYEKDGNGAIIPDSSIIGLVTNYDKEIIYKIYRDSEYIATDDYKYSFNCCNFRKCLQDFYKDVVQRYSNIQEVDNIDELSQKDLSYNIFDSKTFLEKNIRYGKNTNKILTKKK